MRNRNELEFATAVPVIIDWMEHEVCGYRIECPGSTWHGSFGYEFDAMEDIQRINAAFVEEYDNGTPEQFALYKRSGNEWLECYYDGETVLEPYGIDGLELYFPENEDAFEVYVDRF